jgi:hypothetical protein
MVNRVLFALLICLMAQAYTGLSYSWEPGEYQIDHLAAAHEAYLNSLPCPDGHHEGWKLNAIGLQSELGIFGGSQKSVLSKNARGSLQSLVGMAKVSSDDFLNLHSWRNKDRSKKKNGTFKVLGINSSSFPKILVHVLASGACAATGGLNAMDFSVKENSTREPVGRLNFTGCGAANYSLDLAVVFDDTLSMEWQIDGMKAGLKRLTSQILVAGIRPRYSLVTFKDGVNVRSDWTEDQSKFVSAVSSLEASGGDEIHEDTLDAIEAAISLGFRKDALKAVLVITDAPSHYRGDGTNFSNYTVPEVLSDLNKSGVTFISVSPRFDERETVDLKNVAEAAGGAWIDSSSMEFSSVLDEILSILTGTYDLEYWTWELSENTTRDVLVKVDSPCLVGEGKGNYTSPDEIDLSEMDNSLLVHYPEED